MWLYGLLLVILIFGFVVFRGAPYVPSHRRFVKKTFKDLYEVTSKDVLVDLGSGDGLILRLAAARGAKAIGYELNPVLVLVSKLLSKGNPRITTKIADMWRVTIPADTTVIYVFAVTRDINKVGDRVQEWANLLGHPLWLITYGAPVTSKSPVKTLDAHSLFRFEPLQPKKP